MSLYRSGRIAAAVQIQYHAIIAGPRSAQPFSTYSSRIHRLITNVAGERMTLGDFVILSSQFCQAAKLHHGGAPATPREPAKLNHKVKFLTGHVTGNLC